ncbi:T9SS type A sorting domain-containing protein [Parapedobacter sp. 10938]|uniref:T9SS type A sorting domain-containing protein n=1 Tax=Parapedobacter flavus TaxID=3110225 RepID=UPI002DBE70D4|nr:T9SS type A sorting domain-containing protein [Parapedobacter sp. 10938]MEC3880232.1 T9SS type A sorting domain-containing protein [Parapedobacter sp. 10938]
MKNTNYYLVILFFTGFFLSGKHINAQSCAVAPILNATWSCNNVSLFWSLNPNALYYEFRLDSASVTIAQDTTSTNSALINGLSPSTTYIGWVRSICGANDTSTWNPYTFVTPSCFNCANTPTLTVAWACNYVNLNWSANPNAILYEYKLDSAGVTLFQGNTTGTGVVVYPLTPLTPYIASVRSICGTGDTSAWVYNNFTTSACGACVAPGIITALAPTCNSVFFAWNILVGNAGYEYAVTLDSMMPPPNAWTSTANSYGYKGSLIPDTTYYIQVRSNCITMGYSSITKLVITTPSCNPTSISSINKKHPISFYPNPVKNELQIRLDNSNQTATLDIISLDGKIIKRISPLSAHERINVQELTTGIYILRYKQGDHTSYFKFNKI